jgi:ATP-binding cassette subfamily C (CFTR/MRP) protein 1
VAITALDNSKAVTLMSTDVERIVRGLKEVHEIWANVIQFALATWLFEREIGAACVAPIIVCAATVGGMFALSKKTVIKQGVWIKEIQKRVGKASNPLNVLSNFDNR